MHATPRNTQERAGSIPFVAGRLLTLSGMAKAAVEKISVSVWLGGRDGCSLDFLFSVHSCKFHF